MNHIETEQNLARLASFGAAAITIFVLTGSVSDPVNAPKFLLLGSVALGLFAMAFGWKMYAGLKKVYPPLVLTLILFISWSFLVSVISNSPFTQNLYGVYGRNTGLLTYVFLAIIALAISTLGNPVSHKLVVKGFLFAGFVNVLYSAWVILLGDFIGWNNPYKAILGTFGNPNFISSFLGILLTVISALFMKMPNKFKIFCIVLTPIIIWELVQTDSIQGIVVAVVGVWITSSYWLYVSTSKKIISYIYCGTGLLFGGLGIFGAFGIGPLSALLSQPTVALRQQYWIAAWNMGKSNPIFGVGMDSYGDWYRRMRDAEALIMPGPNVVTNTAHNVYLDILAYGGFPLLIAYCALTGIGLYSIIKFVRKRTEYDPWFSAIAAIWLTYQLQSLISINQIGLAVWGWISLGLLVSYARIFSEPNSKNQNNRKIPRANSTISTSGIRGYVGLIIGALLAAPPLSADIKWASALKAQDVTSLENALSGGYFAPLNSLRLAQAAQTLERSGLKDLSVKYAKIGVKFNPFYDDAWETLYYMEKSTPSDKAEAKANLILLDPLNTEWRKLP